MIFQRHRARHREAQELNITAFMNLMVILVPFLLITAVFSHMTILPLDLPSSHSATHHTPPLQLQVTLRKNMIAVSDRKGGLVRRFPVHDGHYDIDGLNALMKKIKARAPATHKVTVLVAPDVVYQDLVNVMDAVRVAGKQSLFPDISLGDTSSHSHAGR